MRTEDRERYLVAHLALRRELGTLLDLDPAEVRLTRADCPVCGGPHGRPTVPDDLVHFSLSHAGDLVLLAFAAVPVGADVEELPGAASVRETMTALHPREQEELSAIADDAEAVRAAFGRCWTRKEAYLKGTGAGLGEDPSATYVGSLGQPAQVPGWRLADLPAPSGYAAASALRRTARPAATDRAG
jgi:4'-phosphopantetheinyl transferase